MTILKRIRKPLSPSIKLKEFTKVFIIQSDDMWRYDNFSKYWIPYIHGVVTFEGIKDNYVRDGLNSKNFHKINWCFNPNTQDLKKLYKINNTFFLTSAKNYKIKKNRIGSKIYFLNIKKTKSFDIDWFEDFKIAEKIYENKL